MGAIQAVNYALASRMIFVFESMQSAITLGWVYFFDGMVRVLSIALRIWLLPEMTGVKMDEVGRRR
jgi:hypothetical protein